MADHEALLDALKALTAEQDEERRLRLAAESRLSASSAASTCTLDERDEERRLRLAAETRLSAYARTLAALQAEAATTSSMLSSGLDRISAKAPTSAPPAPLPTSTEYSYGLPALAYEVIVCSNNIADQLLSKLEALATRASDRDEEFHALQAKLAALQANLHTLPELAEELHATAHIVGIMEQKLRDGEKLRKKQLHMNALRGPAPVEVLSRTIRSLLFAIRFSETINLFLVPRS